MYIPRSFAVEDPKTLHYFVDAYPFATLISQGEEPEVTHLPLLLDAEEGILLSHLAKANPHAKRLDGRADLELRRRPCARHGRTSERSRNKIDPRQNRRPV